ncbi:MAG: biotin--[acetyl-CoA-carboxylase] ligase [Clostridia bacterium]|nr:biotin--[acetyl-CoA-carboxylase] ligase [Clostridia bacterium]
MRTVRLKSVDSTNEYCKRNPSLGDVIVVAREQTAGRGTKGRSFASESGGVYVSVMRRYEDLEAKDAFRIMINASVAVCRTLESFGVSPVIRWPNDVLVDGRKISGTLIENTFLGGKVVKSIVGIGVDVANVLSEDLKDTAISLSEALGKKVRPSSVAKKLTKNLQRDYSVGEYMSYINWLGKSLSVLQGEERYDAVAVAVTADGRLAVERDGKVICLSSAEVTIRL